MQVLISRSDDCHEDRVGDVKLEQTKSQAPVWHFLIILAANILVLIAGIAVLAYAIGFLIRIVYRLIAG